jgi:diguanylate cyclase (GGDEF)-like protein
MRLALTATAVALLVTGTVLNAAVWWQSRDSLVDETRAQARLIAANLSAAVLFGDTAAATEILASLQRIPRVQRATVADARGAVFADYQRPGGPVDAMTMLGGSFEPGYEFHQGLLVVTEVIVHDGAERGRIRLEVPRAPLDRRAWYFAALSLAAAGIAMALSYALATGVRREVDTIGRRLDELAHIDPVTGLFNRHAAGDHLARFIARAQRTGQGFTVVTVDLDDFKHVNDTLGHHIGDRVLRHVADRVRQAVPDGAQAYRFGGDEFVVVCPNADGFRDPSRYGEAMRRAIGAALAEEGLDAHLGGSVGVARYPMDGLTPEDVLLASDMAMYEAKSAGKNQTVVFHGGLRDLNERRLQLESDLRRGLREDHLFLVYQPIVELKSLRVVGAEALLRWQHPNRGLVPPSQFIPVAERSQLIVDVGGWVLGEAARRLRAWQGDAGGASAGLGDLADLRLSVNVSARQLRGGQLMRQIQAATADSGCDLAQLDIELTEHTLVEDIEDNLKLLETLRQRGVGIAIDDFGTGLSSLAYLKRLPVGRLKIDRSFVSGLPTDPGDMAIVQAAVSVATALGMHVVAEGVESQEQHDAVVSLGCHYAQGFLYGVPMEERALLARVRDGGGGSRTPGTPATRVRTG